MKNGTHRSRLTHSQLQNCFILNNAFGRRGSQERGAMANGKFRTKHIANVLLSMTPDDQTLSLL